MEEFFTILIADRNSHVRMFLLRELMAEGYRVKMAATAENVLKMAYARDGNQDGVIDLFTHADAMASIASFLKRYGWKPGIETEKAKKVIYRYNHSDYYVNTILKISELLS